MMHGHNNPTEVYKTASLTGERYVVPQNQANSYTTVHQTSSVGAQPAGVITGTFASSNEYQQQLPGATSTTARSSYTRELVAPQGSNQQTHLDAGYNTREAVSSLAYGQNVAQSSTMSYVRDSVVPRPAQIQTYVTTTTHGDSLGPQQQQTGQYQQSGQYQQTGQYQQNQDYNNAENAMSQTNSIPHEEHNRKISSIVVESTPMMEVPEDTVRYVTVPVYEDEVEYKTKKEVRYIPGPALKPEIRYVDKPVKNVKVVEEVVEVPVPNKLGPIVTEVVKPSTTQPEPIIEKVYRDVPVTNYIDHEVPVVVAQMTKPMIREHNEQFEVAARDFQPEIVHVDVHLVRPVDNTLQLIDNVRSSHKLVDIGAAQYNTLLRSLNAGSQCELPYVAIAGRIDYVPESELKYTIAPAGIKIEGWSPKTPNTTNQVDHGSGFVGNELGVYQNPTSGGSNWAGAQQSEVLTRDARHLGGSRAQHLTSTGLGSRTSSAYSAAVATGKRQLMSKTREVIETVSKNNGDESRSSSVSSSINKIASQMQMRGEKRSYLCCGTGVNNRGQPIRAQQPSGTETATSNQYPYPTAAGQERYDPSTRSHQSRNTGAALHSSAYQAGDGATTSHHMSLGQVAQTKQTRVC